MSVIYGVALAFCSVLSWIPVWVSVVFAGLSLVAGVLFRSSWRVLLYALFAWWAGCAIGTQAFLMRPSVVLAPYLHRSVEYEGYVHGEASATTRGWRMRVDQLRADGRSLPASVDVIFPSFVAPRSGTHVQFTCSLDPIEPIETYRYDRAQDSRGIGAICFQPKSVSTFGEVRGVREYSLLLKAGMIRVVQRVVPEPHAGFLLGLVFGGSQALPDAVQDAFAATGLTHILSASGYNASLLAVVLLGFLTETRLGRRRGIVVTAVVLVLYVFMAGAGAGIVRAACMYGCVLFAMYHQRTARILPVLCVAVALLLTWTPLALLWDPSFQLSFAATAGLLAWSEKIQERLHWLPSTFGLRETAAASAAAMVATTPIVLYHFGSLSLLAPIANLVVLPFIPLAMVCCVLAFLGGLLPFGSALALPAWALSVVILELVRAFGSVPYASVPIPYASMMALLMVCCMLGVYLWFVIRRPSSSTS